MLSLTNEQKHEIYNIWKACDGYTDMCESFEKLTVEKLYNLLWRIKFDS